MDDKVEKCPKKPIFAVNKSTYFVMESIDGNKLIEKLQKDLSKKGIVKDDLVAGLKKLRPYALEEEDPTLTKVIRLTYEHIEANGTFNIPIPDDEEIEGVEMVTNTVDGDDFDGKRESLSYLFSLMLDRDNTVNKQDMFQYRDMLKAY